MCSRPVHFKPLLVFFSLFLREFELITIAVDTSHARRTLISTISHPDFDLSELRFDATESFNRCMKLHFTYMYS